MKRLKIFGVLTALAVFGACAALRETSEKLTNPASKDGVKVPRNLGSAPRDASIDDARSIVVTLPGASAILYGGEREKISADELGAKFAEYAAAPAGAANERKSVYLIADAALDYGSLIDVLETARRKRLAHARLVVSRDETGAPLDAFEVSLANEKPHGILKPNPLTLIAALRADGGYRLNREDLPLDRIKTLLREVFRDRAERVVFRAGTNEIEQTVAVKAPRSAKYEAVAELIDALREAGANPIVIELDELEN